MDFGGWREILILVMFHIFVFHLSWTPGAHGNHNAWWTCNDACARCVRMALPMEEMIKQLYPGLFSATPPPNAFPVLDLQPHLSTSSTVPNSGSGSGTDSTLTSGAGALNTSGGNVPISSKTPSHPVGCCETVVEYITPPNVTIAGRMYTVVHLKQMFQFIPIGKCKPGSKCAAGQCVEQFRAHWILVYNQTQQPIAAPVSFAPMEVHSHCECQNVGQP